MASDAPAFRAAAQRGRRGKALDAAAQESDGRLPLIVGVTGHRRFDPAAEPVVRRRVDEFFDDLMARCPNTPIALISSLAAGSDLLATEASRARSLTLIVALPLPEEEYFTIDNYEPRELDQARECLAASSRVVDVSKLLHLRREHARLAPDESADASGYERFAYDLAGAFVAHHCHILLALWDDTEAGAGSFTGAAVLHKMRGAPEIVAGKPNILESIDTGYVTHIYAPR